MRSRFMSAAGLAACALLGGTARAEAVAHASLSDIRIQLIDTRPDDGVAPSLTFFHTATEGDIGRPVGSDYITDSAQGVGEFGSFALFRDYGDATASASVSGNIMQGGLSLNADVGVKTGGYAGAQTSASSDGFPVPNFSLSAGTLMILTASGHVEASVGVPNGGQQNESTYAGFFVALYDMNANRIFADHWVDASQASQPTEAPLNLAFLNPGTTDETGTLEFRVWANARGFPSANVSAVAEAPSELLMLAGLCGLGWRFKRRYAPSAPNSTPAAA